MLKHLTFFFVVVILSNEITGLSLRHRREVTDSTYKLCDSATSGTYCGTHGTCYTNQSNRQDTFCRCNDGYFGKKCEDKENTLLEPIVFGVSIFALILLIILIVLTIKYCRHLKSCDHDDEKNINHDKQVPAVMYIDANQRKPSMASSINSTEQKYDIDQNGHTMSFTSKDATDTTSVIEQPRDNISMLQIQSNKQNLALPDHQGKEEGVGQSDDEDNNSVISDSNLSTTESDRNLVSNVTPTANSNLSDHEEALYDQYFTQRLINEQKLAAASGYYPQPDAYSTQSYSPTRRSPNAIRHGSPRGPGMMPSTSPTRSTQSNQMFVYHTTNPNQARNLHPHTTGRVQKKITPPSRFAAPPPRSKAAHNKHHPRQRSPARKQQQQQQLHPQQQFRDARGRPLSLGDLRIVDQDMLIASAALNDRKRARSMENILMVDDRPTSASSTSSLTNSVQSSGQIKHQKKNNNKRPGMWAQTQMR